MQYRKPHHKSENEIFPENENRKILVIRDHVKVNVKAHFELDDVNMLLLLLFFSKKYRKTQTFPTYSGIFWAASQITENYFISLQKTNKKIVFFVPVKTNS